MPELIAEGYFNETDAVVDAQGAVHAAVTGVNASGARNRGIWYVTNASGRWTSRKVSGPPLEGAEKPGDGAPSIALDSDGSVWIAFARWSCWECYPDTPEGIWYVNNASGAWSEPRQIARDECLNPSLVVRDGIVHIAYDERKYLDSHGDWPIWYSTNASGKWVTAEVARRGSAPQLLVDPEGRAQILYFGPDGVRFVMQKSDGTFSRAEMLPVSPRGSSDIQMAIDAGNGAIWAGWDEYTADNSSSNVMVARRGPDGWGQPELVMVDADLDGMAVDGIANVTAFDRDPENFTGLVYAWNAGPDGSFREDRLAPRHSYSSLATGPLGRAYVVYVIEHSGLEQPGLWFRMHLLPAPA